MQTSTDHILTTHTGSLPRPAWLRPGACGDDVARAVAEVVGRQRAAGLDIVNDGEAGKPGYATYVVERMTGFGDVAGTPFIGRGRPDLADFPGFADRMRRERSAAVGDQPACVDDVRYTGRDALDAELEHLRRASAGSEPTSSAPPRLPA